MLVEVEARYGPMEEVMAAADHVHDFVFDTSRRTGLPIETRQLMAEWVDDDLQAAMLRDWGVTYLQGHLVGKAELWQSDQARAEPLREAV